MSIMHTPLYDGLVNSYKMNAVIFLIPIVENNCPCVRVSGLNAKIINTFAPQM